MPFPGHKSYGKMGPQNEYETLSFKNKDIEKIKKDWEVGPSGHSYNKKFVEEQKKKKVTA